MILQALQMHNHAHTYTNTYMHTDMSVSINAYIGKLTHVCTFD